MFCVLGKGKMIFGFFFLYFLYFLLIFLETRHLCWFHYHYNFHCKKHIQVLLDVITGELTLSRAIVDSEALCVLLILITESRPCGHVVNESLQIDSLCCRWNKNIKLHKRWTLDLATHRCFWRLCFNCKSSRPVNSHHDILCSIGFTLRCSIAQRSNSVHISVFQITPPSRMIVS